MKTSLEMAVTSEKTTLKSPTPHNPNYDIPTDTFRVNIPWDYSCRLGFQFDKEYALVYKNDSAIFLSANPLDNEYMITASPLEYYGEVKLYYHKEKGNPSSTLVDVNYDSQFITLKKSDFTDYEIGDTITIEYIDPCPKNAVWTMGISKDTVLEGERHLRLSKGEENGLDIADNPTDGEIQEVDRERHSTL